MLIAPHLILSLVASVEEVALPLVRTLLFHFDKHASDFTRQTYSRASYAFRLQQALVKA